MTYLFRVLVLALLLAGCSVSNPEADRAKDAVILLSRSQQAFYVEHGKFTDRLADLKIEWLDLSATTPNYRYTAQLIPGQKYAGVLILGTRGKSEKLLGVVIKDPNRSDFSTIVCRGSGEIPPLPSATTCPPGFTLTYPP
jgi:hypothetical protein